MLSGSSWSRIYCSGVLETIPPSQKWSVPIFTMGSAGGRAPLAMTCSGPIVSCWLSKYAKLPDNTFTAPTEKRVLFSLSSEKSTSSSSVSPSGALS